MLPRLSQLRSPRVRGVIAVLLAGSLWLTGLAAAWHPLHQWLHPDAEGEHHECFVTLWIAGALEHPALPPDLVPPRACAWSEWKRPARATWVQSVFAVLGVQEHAPPAAG